MLIGELADEVGVNPKTIRYYESIGLLPEPPRTDAGYRDYTDEDAERLAFVRRATELDLHLDEIAEILALRDRGEPPCDYVLDVARDRIEELNERITDMRRAVTSSSASSNDPSPTARETATASSSNIARPSARHRNHDDRRHHPSGPDRHVGW